MTHMVIFRSPEGKPGYHQAEGLDEAMRFAEMLRNQEHVTDARIFRMDEVPIEFKTYYRVEMASAAGSGDMASAAGSGATDAASAAGSGEAGNGEAGNGEVVDSVTESGEDAERVTENAEAPAPSSEPADGWFATMGTAQGQEGEPEPVEAGQLGPGRHGRFTRR